MTTKGAAHLTRGNFQLTNQMTPTRYFRSGRTLWKFAPGKAPAQRHQFDDEWDSSLFTSLEEFLAEPGDAIETNEEGAEL